MLSTGRYLPSQMKFVCLLHPYKITGHYNVISISYSSPSHLVSSVMMWRVLCQQEMFLVYMFVLLINDADKLVIISLNGHH